MSKNAPSERIRRYVERIIEEQLAWARNARQVDFRQLQAYEAGLRFGIACIVDTLRFQGLIKEEE